MAECGVRRGHAATVRAGWPSCHPAPARVGDFGRRWLPCQRVPGSGSILGLPTCGTSPAWSCRGVSNSPSPAVTFPGRAFMENQRDDPQTARPDRRRLERRRFGPGRGRPRGHLATAPSLNLRRHRSRIGAITTTLRRLGTRLHRRPSRGGDPVEAGVRPRIERTPSIFRAYAHRADGQPGSLSAHDFE
jgi:hypothetical protein